MLSAHELYALVLKFIIHDTLVVASDANCPLFKFTNEALPSLLGYPCDIAFCAGVLERKLISILGPLVLEQLVDWSFGTL